MLGERFLCLLRGDVPDRVPIYPFAAGFSLRNAGFPLAGAYNHPKELFLAQVRTLTQYGFDGLPEYGYTSYALGKRDYSPATSHEVCPHVPSHGDFVVQSEDDLVHLQLPRVDENTLVRKALVFSGLQVKEGIPALVVIGGPLTIAATLCPLEMLCRWIKQRPDLVHRLLQLTAGLIVEIVQCWVANFGAARVIPKIHEPLASNDIISPGQFKAFLLPPLKMLSEYILSMEVKHLFYHVCGNQNQNLRHWSKVPMGNPGVVSVGHQVDLPWALECFQEGNIVAGNLDPHILFQGPVDLLRGAARACLDVGRSAAGGFMLAPGYEAFPATPPYHMWVLSRSFHL